MITPEGKRPETVSTTGPVIGPTSIPKDPAAGEPGGLPRTGLRHPDDAGPAGRCPRVGLLGSVARADAAILN